MAVSARAGAGARRRRWHERGSAATGGGDRRRHRRSCRGRTGCASCAPHLEWCVFDQGRPSRRQAAHCRAGRRPGRDAGPSRSWPATAAGGPSAAVRLAEQVGLGDAIVHPATSPAAVAVDGGLHDLPPGTLMGIRRPTTDAGRAADVRPARCCAPGRGRDGRRPGPAPPRRPSSWTGSSTRCSAASMPAAPTSSRCRDAARARGRGRRADTLTGAVRSALAARPQHAGRARLRHRPGWLSRLVDALAATRPDVRLGLPVRELRRTRHRLAADRRLHPRPRPRGRRRAWSSPSPPRPRPACWPAWTGRGGRGRSTTPAWRW